MRTTIDIPDDLLEEAVKLSRAHSKRDAVIAGLEELIRKARREELRGLAGKVELDIDLTRSRKSRTR